MAKADLIAKIARSHSSISLVNYGDYPLLIQHSTFPAQAFRFETAITGERASERIKFIIFANMRGSLSQFCREKTTRKSWGKRKSDRHSWKKNDRAPWGAAYDNNYEIPARRESYVRSCAVLKINRFLLSRLSLFSISLFRFQSIPWIILALTIARAKSLSLCKNKLSSFLI